LGDTWHLDELFVTIQGKRQNLWRAVDQDGDVIDILVQPRRNRRAAERFFRKLLKSQGGKPRRLVTDKLRSYGAAHRTSIPSVIHVTERATELLPSPGRMSLRPIIRTLRRPAGMATTQKSGRPEGRPLCESSAGADS
jgi:putative transposase